MAAAVAETRQRVVLGEDADPRAVAADGRRAAWRGPRSPGCPPDARPRTRGAPRISATQAAAVMLLERRLGIGVDPVREVDDLVAGGLDGGGEP